MSNSQENPKRIIIKAQAPLCGSDLWLLYDRSEDFLSLIPFSEIEPYMGDDLKVFFEIEIANNEFEIIDRVEDQGW